MGEITGGEWSYRRCPTDDVKINPFERGTLWFVAFTDVDEGIEGEIATTQGDNARANARLFAAAKTLLEEVERMHESLVAEIDDLDCTANWANGDSVDTCDHCQKIDYRDRLKAILERATGQEYWPFKQGLPNA